MKHRDDPEKKPATLREYAENKLHQTSALDVDPSNLSPEHMREVIHELQVHEIELRMQNEELLRAELELAEARDKYRDLFDSAPVGYFTLDPKGLIMEANIVGAGLLGADASSLIKQPLSRFVHEDDRNAYFMCFKRMAEDVDAESCDLRFVSLSGSVFDAHLDSLAVKTLEGRTSEVRIAASDITDRKRGEETLLRTTRALRTLSEFGRALARATDESSLLDAACRVIVQAGGYRMAWAGFAVDDRAKTVQPVAHAGFENGYLRAAGVTWDENKPSGQGPMGQAIRTGKSSILRDLSECPPLAAYWPETSKRGYVSLMALPLFVEGQVIGGLAVWSTNPDAFDGEEVDLLEQLAEDLSFGIGALRSRAKREETEEALALQAEELARSNLELKQFAYVASHDLQEPLRNLISCVQLLDKKFKDRLGSEADKYIGYAVDSAARMQALIEALLAYSRIGTLAKPFKLVDCQKVIESSLANLRTAISESQAVVTYDPLPRLTADEMQLTQLFQNLLGNAIKFRADKPPKIHVSAAEHEGEWVFSIEDNGIGFEKEYADRIFSIFQRLHTRTEYEGTGIGLAIAKKIVQRHGGRIWVESEYGKGSTFYFTIPAQAIDQ
ncbi:MAG: GAF domain-containing protein [Desulfomonile tiedjei]|nr:GAF domain-containing protein [Desulfomonile tiedjei]